MRRNGRAGLRSCVEAFPSREHQERSHCDNNGGGYGDKDDGEVSHAATWASGFGSNHFARAPHCSRRMLVA